MSVICVEDLRVRCPRWCVVDHGAEAPGGWLPPNGDAVLHASAAFLEIGESGVLLDALRVTAIRPQVHPDREDAGVTQLLIDGAVTLTDRGEVHRLIAALHAAEALLPA